jgi:septal ring factor EnvC (AmiA/AmiB activator)
MNEDNRVLRRVVVTAVLLATGVGWAQPPELREAVGIREEANRAAAESQKRIDEVAEQTDQLVAEYRAGLKQIESFRTYIRQTEELIVAQEKEMASLQEQIDRATVVGREVSPMMARMIEGLDAFVRLDLPFLAEERRDRIRQLRDLMGRADVSESEKYRRIIEAYQAENEYGRTIEAYQGKLGDAADARTVDFLRIGRIALLYQTLDGKEGGVWERKARRWVPLDDDYRGSVRLALKIARKQAAPDLIQLPIAAAEAVP